MKKYFIGLCLGVLLGLYHHATAQDIHFSQFPEISTLRNPALTGIFSGDFKVGMDYRNQWSAVTTSPYNTVALTAETRVLVDRNVGDYLSFGFDLTYDKAGAISFLSTEIYPAICYNKSMEDEHNTYLSVGLTGGYFSRSVDFSKMTFTSQYVNRSYDPNNPSFETGPLNALHNYDLGTGVSLNSSFDLEGISNYYVGAALYHLNHPTEIFYGADNLSKLPLKWEFNAGVHVNIGRQYGLTLHGNYSLQDPYSEMIVGGLVSWHNIVIEPVEYKSNFMFSVGAYIRYKDAFIPTIKVEASNVSVGLSYDVTNSSLGTAVPGSGATELTIIVKGKYNHKKNPRDNVMCPHFDDQVYNSFR